jgi:tetratricopeptide (TPR) repeat protein
MLLLIPQSNTSAESEPDLIIESEYRFLFNSGGGHITVTVQGDLAKDIRNDIYDDFFLNPEVDINEKKEDEYIEAFEDLMELDINLIRQDLNYTSEHDGYDYPPEIAGIDYDGKYKFINYDDKENRVDVKTVDGLVGTGKNDTSKFVLKMDVSKKPIKDDVITFNDANIIIYALFGDEIPLYHIDVKERCNIMTIGTNSYSNYKAREGGEITHYRLLLGEYIEYNNEYELEGYNVIDDKTDTINFESFNVIENSLVLIVIILIFTIIPSFIARSITQKNNMKKVLLLRVLGLVFFIILIIIYLFGIIGLTVWILTIAFFMVNMVLMHGVYQKGWGNLAQITFKREDFMKEPPTIEKGPWHERGIANAKVGNFNEAVNCFEMALEAEPDNATIWNDLGFVLRKLGNYRTAIDCFSKALEIRPGYSTAIENLKKANSEMRAQRPSGRTKTKR